VEVLAAAMIKAIANKRLREMGEAGLNLVKKYTWDKTAASYDSLLKSL
jgi:glycosyltransferase involved in cell wall biosynthesis